MLLVVCRWCLEEGLALERIWLDNICVVHYESYKLWSVNVYILHAFVKSIISQVYKWLFSNKLLKYKYHCFKICLLSSIMNFSVSDYFFSAHFPHCDAALLWHLEYEPSASAAQQVSELTMFSCLINLHHFCIYWGSSHRVHRYSNVMLFSIFLTRINTFIIQWHRCFLKTHVH